MRSFSNIMPNFADKLHLLVDSIQTLHINYLRKKSLKNLEVTIIIRNFARSMKLFSTYWWWRTQDFKKS